MELQMRATLFALLFGAGITANAATVWDESVLGDLSGDRLAPTVLNFGLGANTVLGMVGPGDSDRDYFTLEVPIGAMLSAVIVNPGTAVAGSASFFAVQPGSQMTVTPTGGGAGVGAFAAFGLYEVGDIGTNLLARLLPAGSAGLPSGAYTVWLNETGGSVPYSFDFVLSPVPEPAAPALLAAGLAVLALTRLRR